MANKYIEEELKILLDKGKSLEPFAKDEINGLLENITLSELAGGFLQLISELRKDLEDENPLLLQEIYNNLFRENINSIPKAIINLQPNNYYCIPVTIQQNKYFTSENCYFSSLEPITIWPLYIKNFEFIKNIGTNELDFLNLSTSYYLKIQIASLNIPIKKMTFNNLKIHIHHQDAAILLKDLFFNQNKVEAYIMNSNNEKLKNLQNNFIKKVYISWNLNNLSSGLEILEDYFNIPEIYQFIEINNIDLNDIFDDLIIYIPINMSKKYNINLYLWAIVVKNLMLTQTDPFKITGKNPKQLLKINDFNSKFYIYNLLKCIVLEKGSKKEITNNNNKNWGILKKNNDFYLMFYNIENLENQWAYGEVFVHNGSEVENINLNSEVFLQEYVNIFPKFLVTPFYEEKIINKDTLLTYINTDYKHLLSSPENFKETINNLLNIFNKQLFILIDSIKIENVINHSKWGKNLIAIKGKEVTLTIKTNLEDPFVFLKVFHNFLVNFSSIDSFINLKLEWRGNIYEIKSINI